MAAPPAPASPADTASPANPANPATPTEHEVPTGSVAAFTLLASLTGVCLFISALAWESHANQVFAVVGTLGVVVLQLVGRCSKHQTLDWPTAFGVAMTPVLGIVAVVPAAQDSVPLVIGCVVAVIASTAYRLCAFL